MEKKLKIELGDEVFDVLENKKINNADKRKILSHLYGRITKSLKSKQSFKKGE